MLMLRMLRHIICCYAVGGDTLRADAADYYDYFSGAALLIYAIDAYYSADLLRGYMMFLPLYHT